MVRKAKRKRDMQAAFAEKAGAAVVEKEFARASDKDKEWLKASLDAWAWAWAWAWA